MCIISLNGFNCPGKILSYLPKGRKENNKANRIINRKDSRPRKERTTKRKKRKLTKKR